MKTSNVFDGDNINRCNLKQIILLSGMSLIWVTVGFLIKGGAGIQPPSKGWIDVEIQSGSATSGKLFSGLKFRHFHKEQSIFSENSPVSSLNRASTPRFFCKKWSVVTTIFEPSDAVKRQANLGPEWCIVIVGDRKSPSTYPISGSSQIVYLNTTDQETFGKRFPDLFAALPWNHFGRKNVGFLYAIEQGAEFIWDFDDDNILKDTVEILTPGDDDQITVNFPDGHNFSTYNPYVKMGAPHLPAWPRGIPLTHIKNSASWDTELIPRHISGKDIGLIQSLADHDPDMDAIYRLTQPLPFDFIVPSNDLPIMLPVKTLAPLNAQACLFKQHAFWMLLLPISVHGRVSDIWRGFAGQRIFWDLGLAVSFSPPLVNQFRNAHNYLADFDSEIPLYTKAGTLVDFLRNWRGSQTSVPGLIEELWIELYERGYIQIEDVHLQQYWIKALQSIGYKFPRLL